MSLNKRAKMAEDNNAAAGGSALPGVDEADSVKMLAQLVTEDGDATGPQLELPHDITPKQLQLLVNKLLEQEDDEKLPYSFFVNEQEVTSSLDDVVKEQKLAAEAVVQIVYQAQAVFRVRAISQCSGTIPGHADNIVDVFFSPDGRQLATGSGDMTVRLWDINTMTPQQTFKGHTHWVQCIAWSPDGRLLASGSRDKEVRVWDPAAGKAACEPLKAHRQYITSLAWEPLHKSPSDRSTRFASASKDGTCKVWDLTKVGKKMVFSLSQHTKCVTCVKWGGNDLIYTASQDTTIKVWRASDGALCRTLTGHAHWVNSLTLSSDYLLRTGPFDEYGRPGGDDWRQAAADRYAKGTRGQPEVLVSASEDNTLFLWDPENTKKAVKRMTGHQKPVIFATCSPDGRFVASASFDKSAKVWETKTGNFIGSFRGHVGPVHRIAWAGDSRMLITASEDSTIKQWNVKTQMLVSDLPGHSGSVFAVDWAPNGRMVGSGGADKTLKVWRA